MNTKTTLAVAAFALISAAGALAAEGTQPFTDVHALSTQSRAAVVATNGQGAAQTIGEASVGPAAVSTLPRESVKSEARETRRLGLTPSGEVLPQPTALQLEQTRKAGEGALTTVVAKQR